MTGMAQTVLGQIPINQLGITLMHEHLLLDLECYFDEPDTASEKKFIDAHLEFNLLGKYGARWSYNREGLHLHDIELAINEAKEFKFAGGSTIVDTTNNGIGRDPSGLAKIARSTGLNIIMGSGYYVPMSHPPDINEKTADQITDEIVKDITIGVNDTNIKSGIIGEIGNFFPMDSVQKTILIGAAQASMETGAPISIHPGNDDRSPYEIVKLLNKEGVPESKIIIGHLSIAFEKRALLKDLAETGCFLEYDHFGSFEDSSSEYRGISDLIKNDTSQIEIIEFLFANGFGDQVLIAHDVCYKPHYKQYGGKGFDYIITGIIPRLRKHGFSNKDINTMLVDNPSKAVAFW
tara:strand:- start:17910 stop:18956 length:1047 start_codon:yes stop_codon:yes gene_type:complete